MVQRVINYDNVISLELHMYDYVNIPESVINKALMIAMNYLLENMETDKQEEPE